MKNTQIASKTAKSGTGVDSVRASAKRTSATKVGGEKQNAAHVVDPSLHRMTSKEAYSRSERRGFGVGSHLQDWSDIEQEVLHMLSLDKREETPPGNN